MTDGYVILNSPTTVLTQIMDESEITYGSAPLTRYRSRVVVGGEGAAELASVMTTDPVGTEYGLVVRSVPSANTPQPIGFTDPVVEYGTVTLVPDNVETTIVSYIVPVGKTLHVLGLVATGNVHARYRLFLNGIPVLGGRSSVATPTLDLDLKFAAETLSTGLTAQIKATHFAVGISAEFEGTLFGYLT